MNHLNVYHRDTLAAVDVPKLCAPRAISRSQNQCQRGASLVKFAPRVKLSCRPMKDFTSYSLRPEPAEKVQELWPRV